MMLLDQHHSEADSENELTMVLHELLPGRPKMTYVICIGTDRHILDCLGPLAGTMIKEQIPIFPLYGTLHDPLHARNIIDHLHSIRYMHEGDTELVIDASLGESHEVGRIRLRSGSIKPGKATGKNLPQIGEYSLTGVVKSRQMPLLSNHNRNESLAMVYGMARTISSGLVNWYKSFIEAT